MKKLIILIIAVCFFSCKKEIQTEPIIAPIVPVVIQPQTGSVIFYIQNVPGGSYTYGTTTVFINGNNKGNITMIPSGWIPSCGTQGWGITYKDTVKTFNFKYTVTGCTGGGYQLDSTFTLTNNGCQPIRIYRH